MIYFLYGQDQYQISKKVEVLKENFISNNPHGKLNLIGLDEENFNLDKAREALASKPFFGQSKLVIFRNILPSLKKEEHETMIKLIALVESNTTAIFWETEIKGQSKIVKNLKKEAKTFKADPLKPWELKDYANKKLLEFSLEASSQIVDTLTFKTGPDLFRLESEIKKLSDYKKSDRVLTKEDLDLLVNSEVEESIFDFVENIAKKKKGAALLFLKEEMQKGTKAPYLVSMISYQFRNMLILKDLAETNLPENQLASKAALHPFVIKKTMALITHFSLPELKSIYRQILILDLETKTKAEPFAAIENFVLNI
ncbi:DNA polymerase III subunit delta [Patescibacteria group bacterium]|nr:DNA polymerase III subunit delta [Patescibacteria group bacterium]